MSMEHSGTSSRSCKCGVPSPVKVAWTKTNPGRRFVGCTNYKTTPCDSFEWIDPPLSPRSRIAQYYCENNELKSEVEVLKKRVTEQQTLIDDLTIVIVNAKNHKRVVENKNHELVAKIEEIKLKNKRLKKLFVYWVWVFLFPIMLGFLWFVMKL